MHLFSDQTLCTCRTYVSRNFWRLKRNCLRMDSQMRASWSRWGWAKKNSWRTPWRAALYKCSDAWRTDEMFTCQLSFRFSWKKLLAANAKKQKFSAEIFVLSPPSKILNESCSCKNIGKYCSFVVLVLVYFGTSILFWKSYDLWTRHQTIYVQIPRYSVLGPYLPPPPM